MIYLSNNKEDRKSILTTPIEEDKKGTIVKEMITKGLDKMFPDIMFSHIVNNYKEAEKLYGETLLTEVLEEDWSRAKKNVKIPEYQQHVKKKIEKFFKYAKKEKIIDKHGKVDKELCKKLFASVYCEQELMLNSKNTFEEHKSKIKSEYGEKADTRNYRKGDNFRNVSLRKTVKKTIRRHHSSIKDKDIVVFDRKSKKIVEIIYAVDASGSMKGDKLEKAKKAGSVLSFKAIEEKNKTGLIVFSNKTNLELYPDLNWNYFVETLGQAVAKGQTDIANMIKKSIEMFGTSKNKHLIIISDGMPTHGQNPIKNAITAAEIAHENNITISFIGINLEEKGMEFGKKITEIGRGNFYLTSGDDIEELVLEDYYEYN